MASVICASRFCCCFLAVSPAASSRSVPRAQRRSSYCGTCFLSWFAIERTSPVRDGSRSGARLLARWLFR